MILSILGLSIFFNRQRLLFYLPLNSEQLPKSKRPYYSNQKLSNDVPAAPAKNEATHAAGRIRSSTQPVMSCAAKDTCAYLQADATSQGRKDVRSIKLIRPRPTFPSLLPEISRALQSLATSLFVLLFNRLFHQRFYRLIRLGANNSLITKQKGWNGVDAFHSS